MNQPRILHKAAGIMGILFLLLTSCVTNDTASHVGAFSLAASAVAEQAIKVFDLTNSTTIERKVLETALLEGDELANINQKTIDNIRGVDPDSARGKKMAAGMKALKALKNYVKSLGELSGADFSKEISAASTSVYGSLTSLKNSYENMTKDTLDITDEDFAIIAAAIDAIGTIIMETERELAIQKIVIRSHIFVVKVCDEIVKNLDVNKDLVSLNLQTLYVEEIEFYKDRVKKKDLSLEEKKEGIKKLMSYSKIYHQSDEIFETLKEAVEKVKGAHKTLYEAVTADLFTTPEMVKEIGNLKDFAVNIEKFYSDLLK